VSQLVAWRRPALGALLAAIVAVGALDRDLFRVLGPLPRSEVGAGVAMAVALALVLATPRHRSPRARVSWLVGGGLVGAAFALGIDATRVGQLGLAATVLVGIGLGGLAVASSVAGERGVVVAALAAVAVPAVADTGARAGVERVASGLVSPHGSLPGAAVVAVAGVVLALVVPDARSARPRPPRAAREDSPALRLLLRIPGIAIGALGVLRRSPRSLARLVVLAEAMVLLGAATAEGVLVAGLALAALGLVFGAELERHSADLLAPEGVLAVLPRRRGTFGRRAALAPMLVGVLLLGVATVALWHAVDLEGAGVVAVAVAGAAVGFAGSGVGLFAVLADRSLVRTRWLAGFVPLVLAAGAVAPAVQLNNAFSTHGFFLEYTIGGASFAVLVGLVGLSLASWWRAEVYG
jgi:hypothetical protein